VNRLLLAACLLVVAGSCSHRPGGGRPPAPVATVVVSGEARLDGQPFDADFVGAVVVADGLVTTCQAELPPVRNGRYSVRVLGATSGTGCGAPGSKVVLWTFAKDHILFSTAAVPWPPTGATRLAFDPSYDSSSPNGAAPEVAQFNGTVYDANGKTKPPGTEVEAFVGHVRCGVASVRSSEGFVGYVIAVVGPDSVPGCTRDAAVTFLVDGKPSKHDPVANRPPGVREAVDLRL
jgi:hypothetical protein